MWVYDSSRAIVASSRASSLRKIGPCDGRRYFGVAGADPPQAGDEVDEVRAVVGVDHADAAVAEDVVAREQQVAHPERELAGGVAGRAPDLQRPVADRRARPPRRSSRPPCSGASGCGCSGRRSGRRSGSRRPPASGATLLGWAATLHLRTSRARASPWVWSASAWVARIILQAERLKSIWRISSRTSRQLVEEPDVDQGVLGAAVDQVDVHAQPAPRLDVHLDDAGEDVTAFDHAGAISSPGSGRRSPRPR